MSDFALIFMDCNMPFMDGYETSSRIRQMLYREGIQQPIISALTGHTEQQFINKAIDSGMNQVLSKPVKIDVLRDLCQKL